jgi:Spy/CpxP family protein refolding chaperone
MGLSTTYSCLGLILSSFFVFGTSVKAQNIAAPAGNNDQQRPRFIQQLGLSDSQKAQIKQICQNTSQGRERREQIMAVLTPEQRSQFEGYIEQRKAQHPRFLQQLSLSEAQKAQIEQIRKNTPQGKERREQIMAVLTPEQRSQLKLNIAAWKANHPQTQDSHNFLWPSEVRMKFWKDGIESCEIRLPC